MKKWFCKALAKKFGIDQYDGKIYDYNVQLIDTDWSITVTDRVVLPITITKQGASVEITNGVSTAVYVLQKTKQDFDLTPTKVVNRDKTITDTDEVTRLSELWGQALLSQRVRLESQ